ncbi:hypothetical protein KIPB_014252 [Kipferlia bialata]|uniref:Uncharacterized protein n=1 Tax=Kipferlia bialata TaxID=797122 RepID=A0A391P2G5_9EUKA|nr:hypothetical protein KIPB_014252 [Kipferlia bialata]|eukprot:g14252.t1
MPGPQVTFTQVAHTLPHKRVAGGDVPVVVKGGDMFLLKKGIMDRVTLEEREGSLELVPTGLGTDISGRHFPWFMHRVGHRIYTLGDTKCYLLNDRVQGSRVIDYPNGVELKSHVARMCVTHPTNTGMVLCLAPGGVVTSYDTGSNTLTPGAEKPPVSLIGARRLDKNPAADWCVVGECVHFIDTDRFEETRTHHSYNMLTDTWTDHGTLELEVEID